MTFIQPPFWANAYSGTAPPHMRSVIYTEPVLEPLTVDQGKLRAGLDWAAGDARDELMRGFIATARTTVENDTGLALLTQVRDVYLDTMPRGWQPLTLPAQSLPLQAVNAVTYFDTAGTPTVVDPANYTVDLASGRIAVSLSGSFWPTNLRFLQPWVIRITSGYVSVAKIPAPLVHAVGLLTAHYATAGRDVADIERGVAIEMPFGYEAAIAPYRLESVA